MTQEPWEIHWEDYYAILEIEKNAKDKTIKKKYRKLAQQYHPDKNPNDKEVEEKFKKINEAYSVLSNKEKREKYDKAWEKFKTQANNKNYEEQSQNSSTTNEENMNYEDLEKNYTAEEKRYAKKLALKHLIEEDLEKTEIIINAKNEIIFAGFNGELEKREYYNKVKELVSIGYEYINSLINLKKEAFKYDLLTEEEIIDDTINYLETELKNTPLTPSNAKAYVNKELFKEEIKNKIQEEINTSNEIIEKLRSILIYVDKNQITHLDYNLITNNILLEGKNSLSKLKELARITEELKLEELEEIIKQINLLSSKIKLMPETYEIAKEVSHNEFLKETMLNTYIKWQEIGNKINNTIILLKKYPNSSQYVELINDSLNTLEEGLNEIKTVMSKKDEIKNNKEIFVQDLEKLSKDAIKIYEKSEEIHTKAKEIYDSKDTHHLDKNDVYTLSSSIKTTWDKNNAFNMLIEANELLKTLSSLTDSDNELKEIYDKLEKIKTELEKMKESIITIKNNLLKKNKQTNQQNQSQFNQSQSNYNEIELLKELDTLRNELKNHKIRMKIFEIFSLAGGVCPLINLITSEELSDINVLVMFISTLTSMTGLTFLGAEVLTFNTTEYLEKVSFIENEIQQRRLRR